MPESGPVDEPGLAGCEDGPYLNRELSWLAFNFRVLALAEDEGLPLLERARFLAISSRNLDEFFQVRVAGLKAQLEAGVGVSTLAGATPAEQLRAIREKVLRLNDRQFEVYAKELAPALARAGVEICDWEALDDRDAARVLYGLSTPG